jgi:uncharacterized membrane protein YqiK
VRTPQKMRMCDACPRESSFPVVACLTGQVLAQRRLAIQKRSTEVWRVLGAVRTEFNKHGNVVETLRKQLNTAVNTVDQLGRRTRVMSRTLRDVEAVPETQAASLLALDVAQSTLEEATGEITAAKIDETGAATACIGNKLREAMRSPEDARSPPSIFISVHTIAAMQSAVEHRPTYRH